MNRDEAREQPLGSVSPLASSVLCDDNGFFFFFLNTDDNGFNYEMFAVFYLLK